MPSVLVAAMPCVLNLPMLAFVPLVVATLGVRRDRAFARAALVALGALSLLHYARPWLVEWGVPAIGLVAVVLPRTSRAGGNRPARSRRGALDRRRGLDRPRARARRRDRRERARQRRSAPPASTTGATSPCSRRPRRGRARSSSRRVSRGSSSRRADRCCSIERASTAPYAPDGSPAVARIVDAVYGVDFFEAPAPLPQPDRRRSGSDVADLDAAQFRAMARARGPLRIPRRTRAAGSAARPARRRPQRLRRAVPGRRVEEPEGE